MHFVSLIAILSVLQFLFFGAMAGKAREASGLKAPAMTGDAGFERAYRVQMNTLEMLVAFLPALMLATVYWPAWLVGGLGAVYLVGRMLYWRAYVTDPATRAIGFFVTLAPVALLVLMALLGALGGTLGLTG